LDILGSAPTQATSYDDNVLTNQSSTNELDSFSSITPPSTADSILYSETSKQQSSIDNKKYFFCILYFIFSL
jgi:hypothetical protein